MQASLTWPKVRFLPYITKNPNKINTQKKSVERDSCELSEMICYDSTKFH
jgi:hypothetical protein